MIGRTPANFSRNLHLRALCISALSSPTLSVQPLSFQPLTHYPSQRPLLNPFAINPLRTLFISTEGGYPSGATLTSAILSNAYPMFPISFIFNPVRTLLHFFALPKNSTLLFSGDSALCVKKHNHRGWGRSTTSSQSPSHNVQKQRRPSRQRWGLLRKGRAVFRREDRVDCFVVSKNYVRGISC